MKESKNLWVGFHPLKRGQPNPPWVFDQGPCFPHNFPTDPKKPTAAFVAYFMPLVLRPVAVIRPPEMRRNRMAWFRFQRFRWGKNHQSLQSFRQNKTVQKSTPLPQTYSGKDEEEQENGDGLMIK